MMPPGPPPAPQGPGVPDYDAIARMEAELAAEGSLAEYVKAQVDAFTADPHAWDKARQQPPKPEPVHDSDTWAPAPSPWAAGGPQMVARANYVAPEARGAHYPPGVEPWQYDMDQAAAQRRAERQEMYVVRDANGRVLYQGRNLSPAELANGIRVPKPQQEGVTWAKGHGTRHARNCRCEPCLALPERAVVRGSLLPRPSKAVTAAVLLVMLLTLLVVLFL